MAFAIHGGVDWLSYYWLHLPGRLGADFFLIQLPFLVFVVYPAIAAAAVRIPFFGFRISIVPNAPHAESGSGSV